ncbi:MAG: replication/maintenance protein RepL [Acinetobacter sp.]|mgnify:CR=1 FL=1|jgi:DNA-binding MarR family transcriptional regulator|uniref:replication/maintenance protein RepL n=1 Tax=Pseudomonas TaxID=286 RepID=UPI0012E1EA69|nr:MULTISPECIES: replication/maintenance protein RepL [Pseudomonas]EKT4532981.1 replication/maintenance protein RepL [Pseudomonas putida]MBO7716476.1 replication/maintenance protein RepL [Methanobrevibacter sp.]MCE0912630.1 replication/maintenance protein RepL [Pseudomonas kurunegalensis]MDN5715162.1 replication/maintenance protein RepL [Acinetobacter sp.]
MEDTRSREELINANARLLTLLEETTREVNQKKNLDFVQLYKKELRQLRGLVKLNPTAAQILLVFVEKMNKQNAVIMSFKTLEQITKKTRQTCSKAVKDLREANFINIIKVGNANAYVVNSNVFWSTDNQIKEKFAIFTATVVACGADQDDDFEDWSGVELKQIPIIYPGEQLTFLNDKGE